MECNFKLEQTTYSSTNFITPIIFISCYLKGGGLGKCDGEENCVLFKDRQVNDSFVQTRSGATKPPEDCVTDSQLLDWIEKSGFSLNKGKSAIDNLPPRWFVGRLDHWMALGSGATVREAIKNSMGALGLGH